MPRNPGSMNPSRPGREAPPPDEAPSSETPAAEPRPTAEDKKPYKNRNGFLVEDF